MLKTIVNAFADKETRRKLFITFGLLLIFRLGAYIPVPGLDVIKLQGLATTLQQNTLFQVMATISGGTLSQATLFSLGILPFINSFIIMQLLTLVIPGLERLSREGDEGRRKLTQITRYIAIVLAIVQSIGVVISWKDALLKPFGHEAVTGLFLIIILTAGSTIVMWLGERITEHGIGNGSSLIIFVGILSTAATEMIKSFQLIGKEPTKAWFLAILLIIVLLLFFFITFVDLSERRIKVTYAKQVKGNKMYGGQSTYIPIKVNASGVMPIIFASSFLMFPMLIASFFPQSKFYAWWNKYLGVGEWPYMVFLSLLILFFSFFYAQIQFNPMDVAKNLQQYGGMIIGVRPGKPTSDYLAKINNRITLFGALFLAIISLIVSISLRYLGKELNMNNAFSATGLLIVVSVAMEFNTQLETQLMMKNYKGFLK